MPQDFWNNLQIALKAYGGIANDFKLLETDDGRQTPWPTLDPTGIVGSLQAENTLVADQDYVFGQGVLGAFRPRLHVAGGPPSCGNPRFPCPCRPTGAITCTHGIGEGSQ